MTLEIRRGNVSCPFLVFWNRLKQQRFEGHALLGLFSRSITFCVVSATKEKTLLTGERSIAPCGEWALRGQHRAGEQVREFAQRLLLRRDGGKSKGWLLLQCGLPLQVS